MAIDFRSTTIKFDSSEGFIQSEPGAVVFAGHVNRADVAIKSFDVRYDKDDHHLLREMLVPRVESINNNVVILKVDYLLRDNSGNIDDPYSGTAEVLVIADVGGRQPKASVGSVAGVAAAEEADA